MIFLVNSYNLSILSGSRRFDVYWTNNAHRTSFSNLRTFSLGIPSIDHVILSKEIFIYSSPESVHESSSNIKQNILFRYPL